MEPVAIIALNVKAVHYHEPTAFRYLHEDFQSSPLPRCEYDQPCDGLLCGGPCDQRKKVDPLPDFDDPDEEKWAGDE